MRTNTGSKCGKRKKNSVKEKCVELSGKYFIMQDRQDYEWFWMLGLGMLCLIMFQEH